MSRYTTLIDLFNQRRIALLSEELLELRDATIGPQAINALLSAGHLPESLPALRFEPSKDQNLEIFLNEYVTQLAFGDAVLRHRGELPMETYVPNGPLEELKGIKPIWTIVFAHVERELQHDGLWAGDPAWAKDYVKGKTWRKRLEEALSGLDAKFIKIAQSMSNISDIHSQDELLKGSTNAAFAEALATIEPLPANLVAAATSSPLGGPTRGYLEAVRSRGAAALAVLGRHAREQGNALVKQAISLADGKRKEETSRQAIAHYLRAGQVSEQCVVAACNSAHLFLTIKDYTGAALCAKGAIDHYHRLENDPQTFAAKRANLVCALQTSHFVVVPPALMRPRTAAQVKAEKDLAWKSYMRLARAHAGLCREILAQPANNPEDIELETQTEHERAKQAYMSAYKLDSGTREPLLELDKLTDDVTQYTMRAIGMPSSALPRGSIRRQGPLF